MSVRAFQAYVFTHEAASGWSEDMETTHSVVWLNEGIVASNNVDILVLHSTASLATSHAPLPQENIRISEHDTANATEAIDSNLFVSVRLILMLHRYLRSSYFDRHDCGC